MLGQVFLERCNSPPATEQHFSKCGMPIISITQELVRKAILGTVPVESEALEGA